MSSFRDLVKKVNEQKKTVPAKQERSEEEDKHSSFRDLVKKVNDGTVGVVSRLKDSEVNDWYSGVKSVSQEGYNLLSKEGYRGTNTSLAEKINSYLSQADDVAQYIRANRNSLANYDDTMQNYHDTVSYLRSLQKGVDNSNKYFSQWADENAYMKSSLDTREDRQQQYVSNEEKVKELNDFYDKAYTIETWYNSYRMNPGAWDKETVEENMAIYDRLKKEYGSLDALDREISRLSMDNTSYKRGENGYTSKVVDDYYDVTENEDFLNVSGNRNYDNPTREELIEYDSLSDSSSWYFDANGVYRDAYGNELKVDEKGNWVNPNAADQKYQVTDRLGMFLGTSQSDLLDATGTPVGHEGAWETVIKDGVDGSWKELTDNEVAIYYYLLNSSGQETADKYLSDMKTELNRRETMKQTQLYLDAYDEANLLEKIALNAATVPAKFVSNITGSIENAANTLMGNEINPYSAAQSGMHFGDTIRGATADELDKTGIKIPILDFTLGDAYQFAMSRIDSALATGVGGGAGTILLGMGSAQSEAYNLYKAGASMDQIAWGAAAAGAAEVVFEYASFDKLIHMKDAKTRLQWIKNALIQGGIEASEEGMTEIANLISNAIVMGQQSNAYKIWEESGGNQLNAFLEVLRQTTNAALGGFIGGAFAGAGEAGKTYSANKAQFKESGYDIMGVEGGVDALKALANEVAGVSDAKMKADLLKQAGKVSGEVASGDGIRKITSAIKNNQNAVKVGRLHDTVSTANDQANADKNRSDVAKSLMRSGFDYDSAYNIADALVASYNGQELTKAQTKLLKSVEGNGAVGNAIHNILSNTKSTVGQRRQNMRDFAYDIKAGAIAKTYGISKDAAKTMMDVVTNGKPLANLETVYDGDFEVSKEGKASVDGKEVKLDGLQETKDGVMVATVDGQTADGGEVIFPSKGHALVYEGYLGLENTAINPVIKGMSVASRSVLAKAYDLEPSTNGKLYFEGANQTFWYGFEGMSLDALPDNSPIRSLNEEQIKIAYEEGIKAGRKATDTQDSAIKAAHKAAEAKLGGKTAASNVAKKNRGSVILDDDIQESAMTDTQKASTRLANKVAQAIGKNVHVYRGMQEHGKYDPATGEIWLNINGNISGKSMMAFALSHELVHMAKQWSPSDFKAFADYLCEQYGKKGYSVERLVRLQMDNAIDNGYTLDEHEAYEEVIADACQRMLLDSDALQNMAAYREKNPSKWQKIVDAIRRFIKNVREVFAGAEPDSLEAALFKEFDEAVKNELEKKFVSMVMNASEHMNTIQNAFGKDTVVEVNADGEFTLAKGEVGGATKFLYNDSTWEKGGRDTLEAALKAEGFSDEDIKAALTIMDSKHKLVKELAKQFPEQSRINKATVTTDLKDGHSVLSALVSNGDYPVNIDLLMVCKKRKAYQRVINRLCETGLIQQATVDALAIAEINKILGKYGFETACLGCFVESRRLRIQEWANTIVKEWNAEVKKRNPNAKAFGFGKGEAKLTQDEVMQLIGELESGGEKNDQGNLNLGQGSAVKRMGVLLDKVPSLRRTLSIEDLITPDGLTALRKFDSNLFSMVKSRYGSNSPKFVQEFNPYNHELAMYGKVPSEYNSLREYLYAIGGARMQSFSDFIVENWFDYCQIVADLAARKLPMHTYTKEISLAKLFGLTGIKINMSLIPDIDRSLGKEFAGLTRNANGELELIWADKDRFKATGGKSYMQSINFADAIALQNDPRYSGNVGTIAVGVSDKHILMMLDDARIRMVIPYHSSGMNPIFADLMGTSYYKDYTLFQNTTVKQLYNSKGHPVSLKLDKTQTAKLTSGFQFNAVLQELGDARAAAQAYKDWCTDASKHTITIKGETYTAELTPKFDDFSSHENYYKLLEDFNTYDCISEEAAPQGDVQQTYPEDFDKILTAELTAQEKHRQKQAENQSFDKAMGEIESYLRTHTKADTVFYAEQHGVNLSAKDKKLGAEDKKKLADLRKGMKMSMPKGEQVYAEYDKPISEDDISTLRTIGRESVNDFTSEDIQKAQKWAYKFYDAMHETSPFFRSWFGEWRANSKNRVTAVQEKSTGKLGNGRAKNRDVGIEMSWNAHDIIRETTTHAARDRISLKAINQLGEIVENAILLDTVVSMPTSKSKMKNTAFMHSFYAVYNAGAETYIIKLYAEMALSNRGDTVFTRAYQLKDIKKVAVLDNGVSGGKPPLSDASTATINTVADLVDFVKKYDPDYSPKSASKVVNKDGTPRIVYHYTNGEFWSFDTERSGSNQGQTHGDGIYLSTSPDEFSYAGKNRMELYAVIRNPFEMQLTDEQATFVLEKYAATKHDLDKYHGLYRNHAMEKLTSPTRVFDYLSEYAADNGIKVSDILKDLGYDGVHDGSEWVAFDPSQVKSATDNIGTFDGGNTDIRYKQPSSRGMSSRQLLADAFDELVQTPKERELMDEYRKNITMVEDVQERLRKLRGEISKLTKAKGDKAKIAEMNKTAEGLADLIDKYDRKLMDLEASKPLRDVLARARSAAYQEARQRSEESLKEYRQQVSERFDRGVEGRRKTEMRKKIRKVIRDLDKILNRGNKKQNVKEDMKDFVAEALSAAEVLFTDNYTNEDIIRNGFGVELSKEETKYLEEARGFMEELSKLPSGSFDAWEARQEAEEKIKSKLAYRMSKLKDAFFRERQRLNKAEVATVLGNLADAYAKLETSEYAYVNGAYHESVYQYLKMLQDDVGGAKVKDMTLNQLNELHKAYTMVLTTVRNANKMFADDLKQSKEELANRVMMEVYEAGGEHGLWSKGQLARNQASWNNTKPIYAAERTGSSTFVKLVKGLFKGQYNWATDMEEAKAFRQNVADKYGFKSWDMEKTYKFTSSSGIEFELNLNHIMSLYAYAKREQAHDHLLKGGFVFGKNTEVVVTKNGIKRIYLNKSAKAHNISDEIMGEIVGKLSKEQKGFVDEMQDYLSTTMGGKGNEVSMRLYGVKLFMEKFYFPLRSAGQFKEKAKEAELKQQQGQISIVNSGFTNAVTPKASNPVVLDGFTDVWASHVNEMSLYHSMVLPMEDFRRVYNYASPNMEGQESASVNSFIENAYGDAATGYFDQLYNELNGGTIVDPRENLSKQMIGKFKKSAVMFSNSVWVQQFSAIGRAYALIDPKYFIGPKVDKKKHAALWNEMKQYAPVAIIKEMGGFDTHTGLSAKGYLLAEEYGKGERVKGFISDEQYRDEIMGWLPAKADELTWCAIWEAVKRETQAKNSEMDVRSEEFLKKAGERFSEVIEKTQVYDSVLARSANMRSKNGLMQMLTAFMAEPTTTVNMVEDALRKGNKKTIARTLGAVAASVILNNALASLVYGMRDDDEDETFLEKYSQAFTSGMLDDINPMTYYPILKDIWSLFQGYDIERSDMAIYSDIADSVKKTVTLISQYDGDMDEDEAAAYYKKVGNALMSLLDAGASAFGIPWKNVRRDLMSCYNTFNTLYGDWFGGRDTTWNSYWDAVGGAAMDTIPIVGLVAGESKQDKLYDAIVSGDTAYVNRLKSGYKSESSYNTAIRKALRENDPRIKEAAVARYNGDIAKYTSIAKQIIGEKHFSQDNVVAAVNAEINALDKGETTTTSTKASGLYKAEDFAVAISQGDQAMANAIKVDIIQTAQKNGKTADEAEKSFVSSAKSALKEMFLDGEISEQKAAAALTTYCDIEEADALADVQYWVFKEANPDTYVDDAWVDEYYEEVADSGISIEVFVDYRNRVKSITGENKKEKRMAVIDSMPISSAQKDALYYAEGWTKSKLYEAPWH